MRKPRFQPKRRFFGLPSLTLLVLCLGLWKGWTTSPPMTDPLRKPTQTRIRFVEVANRAAESRGSLLVYMEPVRPALQIADDLPVEGGAAVAETHPHLLNRRVEQPGESEDLMLLPSVQRQARNRLVNYRPVWPFRDPFAAAPLQPMRFQMQISAALTSAGFVLPADALAHVVGGERAWDLVFDVACGVDGHPRDVLLLSAADATGVSSNVVRILYQGMATPGMPTRGRVTVRWGRAVEPASPGWEKEQVWPPKS